MNASTYDDKFNGLFPSRVNSWIIIPDVPNARHAVRFCDIDFFPKEKLPSNPFLHLLTLHWEQLPASTSGPVQGKRQEERET